MTLSAETPFQQVLLSPEAEQDLLEICIYTTANAGQEHADMILGRLEQAVLSLESFPLRGNVPLELEIVGITRYREIHALHGAESTKRLKPWCMSIGCSTSDGVLLGDLRKKCFELTFCY